MREWGECLSTPVRWHANPHDLIISVWNTRSAFKWIADPPCGYGASQGRQDGIQLEGPQLLSWKEGRLQGQEWAYDEWFGCERSLGDSGTEQRRAHWCRWWWQGDGRQYPEWPSTCPCRGAHVAYTIIVVGRTHVQTSLIHQKKQRRPIFSNKCICSYGPLRRCFAYQWIGPLVNVIMSQPWSCAGPWFLQLAENLQSSKRLALAYKPNAWLLVDKLELCSKYGTRADRLNLDIPFKLTAWLPYIP